MSLVLAPSALTFVLNYAFGYHWLSAIWKAAIIYTSFVTGLSISIVLYRISPWHPLAKYPGPFLARITQWHHVCTIMGKVDNYKHLDKLHKQYGDYVRVGPSLLSIVDIDIVEVTHETKSRFKKSPWYDVGQPLTTLHQMRDQQMHDKRRKGWWEKAFVMKSVRQYEPTVTSLADLLISQLKKRSGQTVNGKITLSYACHAVVLMLPALR